jgi:hypothetical protein
METLLDIHVGLAPTEPDGTGPADRIIDFRRGGLPPGDRVWARLGAAVLPVAEARRRSCPHPCRLAQ